MTKYYKGFNKDMTCRGFQFEEGKTYESDTKVCAKKIKVGARLDIAGIVKAQLEYINKHATGYRGAASATGDMGAASATGYRGAASATGNMGAASATGNRGAASATGDMGAASATGYMGAASATGNMGAASATGDMGAASATGDMGAASATGNMGAASATGNMGAASATGDDSIAIASGYCGRAKASVGNAICVCERGDWNGKAYPLLDVKAAIVDGEKLKPDTWYKLENGEFVEVEADE